MKLYNREAFLKADSKEKEYIINLILRLDSHNFITKEALVEIIKYQKKLVEVEE